jgi:hypothetical protein
MIAPEASVVLFGGNYLHPLGEYQVVLETI